MTAVENHRWEIGDIVSVQTLLDPEESHIGTIKYIEEDKDFKGLYWVYIIANEEHLNTRSDPRFNWPYYNIVCHMDKRLSLVK